MTEQEDHRKEGRTLVLEEIELEFSSGKQLVRIADISLNGCYVDTIISVPIGEDINFVFMRPGMENIGFSGKVAYLLDGFGFGIEFNSLTKEAENSLAKLIKEKAE